MAWLGEGLSSLRGQISSFTKEVLSEVAEGREEGCGHESQLHDAEERIQQLEHLCSAKDDEISKLREINAALETQANQLQCQSRKQQPLLYHVTSSPNLGGAFAFGDPGNVKKEAAYDFSSMEAEKDDLVDYLRAEVRALKIEKEKVEKKVELFQKKCSCSANAVESGEKESVVNDGMAMYRRKKTEVFHSKNQNSDNIIDEIDSPLHFLESKIQNEPDSQSIGSELNLKKYHEEKQNSVNFMNNMKNLDDRSQQNVDTQDSNSENIKVVSDGITCIRDIPGIEPDSNKLMDARGECDGSEEVPKDIVKLLDQISKLTASLSDAQLNVNQCQENEKRLMKDVDQMKEQEFHAQETIKNLESQLKGSQENNCVLEQKLEDLDKQNTTTIEQLMGVISSLKHENEMLQSEAKELEKKLSSMEAKFESCSLNSKTIRREIELELEKEILKFIPPELIPREPKINGSGEVSVVVGAVKGLAKSFEEHKWKRDTIERKLTEMMKESRDVKAECIQLRGEIARRDNLSGLRTEGLAPILETGEEDEDDETDDMTAKNTTHVVCNNDRKKNDHCDGIVPNWQRRYFALEEEMKKLRDVEKVEHRVSDVYDEDEDDDADGIEEVNDWTWQANVTEIADEVNSMSLVGNLLVKDGEHVITTIQNDVQVVDHLQSCTENNVTTKNDIPTLTEHYIKEKLKLEGIIEELRGQKDINERSAEELNIKMAQLMKELDHKTKLSQELMDRVEELEGNVSESDARTLNLENLLAARNTSLRELETEITSLTENLQKEKICSDEQKRNSATLNENISLLESKLAGKEEYITEQVEKVKILEDRHTFLEQSLEDEMKIKEEQNELIERLQVKIQSMGAELSRDSMSREETLNELEVVKSKGKELESRLTHEIQLKEEALNKLHDAEERFKIVEQSVHKEMKNKNEFTDRILDLERKLNAAEEEAKLDKGLKDEAVIRISEKEHLLHEMEKELSITKLNLQEREKSIIDCQSKINALEMEREGIMCVVGDKAREISSLKSERQRLMEAMSSMEKMRQREIMGGDPAVLFGVGSEMTSNAKQSSFIEQTETPPGEREGLDGEVDGTAQLLMKLKNLQAESEQLADSYRQEQQRNKHLQNEVHEMLEKETALQDELKRLRLHLVSVEDRYTKEAVIAEDRITSLKNKLTQVEERLHASSSAYTSASVRSNQQVESLENQIRALTEKKDESKSRLKVAEEQLAQQAKDLGNLQTVLEQFQKDKDREISIVKDKMAVEISLLENKSEELLKEIVSLKEQLVQAKEGLSAAARLSEQLDKKSETIASLKTEMKKLNASLILAEEKLQNASLNVEGKVEKNLVKNLLLGYLSAPMQGPRRLEILRIIATILEFTKEDKERVDLGDGSGKGSGWLRGIAGWGGQHKDGSPAPDMNQPSLSEAFIRFLESESRPKSQIRMLSDSRIEPNRSSSPAGGHSRTPSTSSTPPLLMSEPVLPTLPTFSVASGSNSSCILKDVLKDS